MKREAWLLTPLVCLFTLPLFAQTTGSNPSLLYRGPNVEVRTTTVPLGPVNEARRAAGLPELAPDDPTLAAPGRVAVTYEVPAPKDASPALFERPRMTGPLAFSPPPPPSIPDATPSPLIAGLVFEDNAILTGGSLFIPPDSHGAAGGMHVCHVVNVAIECVGKDGSTLPDFPISLATFFGPLTPLTGTFDPKILYDHFLDRFVVVTLEFTTSPAETSRILLAVSDDGDPSGTWYYQALDAKETIGSSSWLDYPGYALDEDALYIAGNMFSFSGFSFTGQRLWIVEKDPVAGLYSGLGTSAAMSYDPATESGGIATTMQPALMFGEPPAPTAPEGSTSTALEVGTFLVAYSGIAPLGGPTLQIIRVDDPIPPTPSGPTFTLDFVLLGMVDDLGAGLPPAPQLIDGDAPPPMPISTNDRRTLDAVWRDDALWATMTILTPAPDPEAGEVAAHFVEVDTDPLATPTLTQQGSIGGEDIDGGTYTYFPSIAVNGAGDVAIGFSASSMGIFAGAYAVGRKASDPAGFVTPASLLAPGLASYVRTFGGSSNRWGDYSATVVDPSDGGFWVINQRAGERAITDPDIEDGRWEVFLGKFGADLTDLPVELVDFTAVSDREAVVLTWQTASETNNAGFEIQHKALQAFEPLAYVEGAQTSTEGRVYAHRLEDLPAGLHTFRLKQIDLNGSFSYSPAVEVYLDLPGGYQLSEVYPNPFSVSATVTLSLDKAQEVRLEVFDLLGRRVRLVHDGLVDARRLQAFPIHGAGLPAGMYVFRAQGETFATTRPIIHVR